MTPKFISSPQTCSINSGLLSNYLLDIPTWVFNRHLKLNTLTNGLLVCLPHLQQTEQNLKEISKKHNGHPFQQSYSLSHFNSVL